MHALLISYTELCRLLPVCDDISIAVGCPSPFSLSIVLVSGDAPGPMEPLVFACISYTELCRLYSLMQWRHRSRLPLPLLAVSRVSVGGCASWPDAGSVLHSYILHRAV